VPPAAPAGSAAGIGDVRAAELRAACAALGVDDVVFWGFADGDLSGERDQLAAQMREELDGLRPDLVVVPFPYDAHADHVAVALALADALAGAPAAAPAVLCAAVRMPFSPAWPTRLVPAGGTWAARQAALRAYASRERAIFATPTLLARLHPARFPRVTEGFVELPAMAFVEAARAMEARALTTPTVTGGGHPVTMAAKLLRTREERDEVTAVLRTVATATS
jgi:LmbE family N-acetylglucosaminyl deacetylase